MNSHPFAATIILTVLAVCFTADADAGILGKAGVKAALTSAGQAYDLAYVPGNETDRRLGFGFGGFLEWFDLPVFSLITQVEYTQRGMKQEFNVTGPGGPEVIGTLTIDNRLDYLSVPVLAKARWELGSSSPYIIAGVRFDHLLGYESTDGVFNDAYDAFDRSTFGGSVGAGIETDHLLNVGVLAEIRYNFDFQDAYATDLLTVSNNAVDLWLGVTF